MIKHIIVLMSLLSVVLLTGCAEDVDSEDIRTSGIYAGMDLNATAADLLNIDVYLLVGGKDSNTYVSLTNGDKLTATMNDSETITLSKTEKSDKEIHYVGAFNSNVAGAENSTFKISFERTSADTSALNSVVTLPAAPSGITSDKQSFNRSTENITLTWNNSNTDNNLSLAYDGDCIEGDNFAIVDNGAYTINAGTIKDSNQNNCQLTFTFSRTVNGTLDPAFGEGGYIKAKQSRSYSVTSTR